MFAFVPQTRTLPRFAASIAACFVVSTLLAAGNSRIANTPAPASADGCGTLYSEFGGDQCQRISFNGQVSANQTFEQRFGKNLSFRLNPKGAEGGWTLEVVPDAQPGSGYAEYVWVVNPPYHFSNIRYLDTSYGTTAKQAVSYSPRDFNFVINEEQYRRAADLVEKGVMSHAESDHRSQEEFAKESDEAIATLQALPVSKGRLTILQSRITEDTGKSGLGSIEWISFKVELRVPCNLVTPDGSPGLQINKSKCSAEVKAKQN
jgi:hypothetical protein